MSIRTFFFLAAFCCAGSAWAASVMQVQFPELVDDAEKIAVGKVQSIETRYDAAQGGAPVTHVRFDSLRWWKGGDGERTITLEYLGGKMPDGTMTEVVGMPAFRIGEEHLLFWKDGRRYVNPFVGWWQGHYKVEVNQAGQSVVLWPRRMNPASPETDDDPSDDASSSADRSQSHSHGGTTHSHSSRRTLSAALAASKGDEPVEETLLDTLKERVLSEMEK